MGKFIILLLLTIPNTLKIKCIIQTRDEKGNNTACRVVISQNNRVLADYQTKGIFQIELPEGTYNVKTIKCLEHDQTWIVDREKQTIFVLNTDCEKRGGVAPSPVF